jgi:uncharacterized alpha-E superfamily protein
MAKLGPTLTRDPFPLGDEQGDYRVIVCDSEEQAREVLAAWERSNEAVSVALGNDQPWNVVSCLSRLADAAEHLLRDHDCDQHGWEEANAAMKAARKHVERLEKRPENKAP